MKTSYKAYKSKGWLFVEQANQGMLRSNVYQETLIFW